MNGYVRVSEILARLQSYADVDPVVLEEKAKIGTNVHDCIVAQQDDCFFCLQTDRATAYFESYMMWLNKNNCPVITQVPRLYCDTFMITGECDGLINSEHLIDWKCSYSPSKKIWNMQAHFYWYLLKENGYNVADSMSWINLRHKKHTFRDSNTGAIKKVTHTPEEPIVYKFTFDEKVLSECLDEAVKYWEEKNSAKCVA